MQSTKTFQWRIPMREVDRRGKYSRRIFLQGAASAVPVVAVAASAGIGIEDAWAADATTLTPATLKTLVKVARDIYPHDMLVDSYYITAIKPWDADRVVLLQGIEQTDFFKKVRSDLVVSLYNQEELWPKFGYEGSSAEHGGYIKRGFNDIDWLPKV